ncbi:hypothetical protein Golax_022057 [Gossypium laxum]|uniref:Uncharacterized protein n=1 Tax=Gossypium laxum TaxID=34288 RepID=A0A7J9APV2_9ROSI|nr:hypothetical protein [Gossypium laxum]
MSDKEALWVHVFRAKYQMKDDLPDCIAWDKSSFLWKSLLKIRSLPRENLFWSVGDGNKIRCWEDNWIPSIWPPVRHIRANANLDLNCFLNEMITDKGSDKISRSHISSGAFSVKTTFKVLKEVQLDSGYVTVEGVVCGKHGDWIVGYHQYLGKCSIFDLDCGPFLKDSSLFNVEAKINLSFNLTIWKLLKPSLEALPPF